MSRRRTLWAGGGGNVARSDIERRAIGVPVTRWIAQECHRHQALAKTTAPNQEKHAVRNSVWWLARFSR
jgi:hypothetical protein